MRLIPAGHFKARDGRPANAPQGWYLDADLAEQLIARLQQQADDFVIDYEHQTLNADNNGQPAPAAGWFTPDGLQWQDDGLYATDVEWTPAARAALKAGEYRYLSPVMEYLPGSGEVVGLMMAALTNYAAIDGLNGLSQRAAARFDFAQHTNTPATQPEDTPVKHADLVNLLGLKPEADDAAVTAALKAASTAQTELAALRTELELADDDEPKAAIAALKANAFKADPSHYVPTKVVEDLKVEIAALKAGQTQTEVDALVKQGLDDGKLLPAQKEWAEDVGNDNVAALKTYLKKTPAIAALKGNQSNGKPPAGDDEGGALSDSQIAICKATGVSVADYRKQLNEEKTA